MVSDYLVFKRNLLVVKGALIRALVSRSIEFFSILTLLNLIF
jgi:hypothetical protein